jgi:anthranilate phosphoribosyltransferase
MKKILQELFDYKKLTREEAKNILLEISAEKFNQAHLASFLTVFKMRPIAVEELQGFRDALLQLCIPIDLRGIPSIDIVGTGGDGKNTFNISTLSSFVVAGAGYKVTKHGNYGVSSLSGSSNVLEHLGYRFTNNEEALLKRLEASNICFFHAPLFHPAMKAVGPVRRSLGMKTFFNMLGPLVNPARPNHHFLGVFDMNLARLYHYILQEEDNPFAIIYNLDGYDEISLTDTFSFKSNDDDRYIKPEEIGFGRVRPSELFGGESVDEAARIFLAILEGKGTEAQRHVIYANAGLAIQRFHPDKTLENGINEARESLDSGQALSCLKEAIKTAL